MQLRSEVGHVDSKVGLLRPEVRQLKADVTLLQTDMHQTDTSLVSLAVRGNQLDRRLAKNERQSLPNGEEVSRPADAPDRPVGQQVAPPRVPSPPDETATALKRGMSQQEVLQLFGNPHGMERILDSIYSIYWYYADGELKGQYVRFDATTGYVNGWSTFSPQSVQIDLRTTRKGHVR